MASRRHHHHHHHQKGGVPTLNGGRATREPLGFGQPPRSCLVVYMAAAQLSNQHAFSHTTTDVVSAASERRNPPALVDDMPTLGKTNCGRPDGRGTNDSSRGEIVYNCRTKCRKVLKLSHGKGSSRGPKRVAARGESSLGSIALPCYHDIAPAPDLIHRSCEIPSQEKRNILSVLQHGWLMQWHTSLVPSQGTEPEGKKQSVW